MVVVQLTGVVQSPPMPATTPARQDPRTRGHRSDREGAYSRARARHRQGGRALRRGRQDRESARCSSARRPTSCSMPRPDRGRPGRGRRSRPGTLQRLLLGSVSENVLRHADRPVLIVKGATS
jgi:hypothetical protein